MTGTKELFGSSITENHEVTVDSEIETAGFKYHTFIRRKRLQDLSIIHLSRRKRLQDFSIIHLSRRKRLQDLSIIHLSRRI